VPIRSPTLLLQMFLRFYCCLWYFKQYYLCHFRTARIKTFEKLKNKSSRKTQTQREQLRAWTVTSNLAKPKYRALLMGDNYINKIRYKSTGSCCVIYIFTPWMMLLIFIYAL
jgi:hypothetical protein